MIRFQGGAGLPADRFPVSGTGHNGRKASRVLIHPSALPVALTGAPHTAHESGLVSLPNEKRRHRGAAPGGIAAPVARLARGLGAAALLAATACASTSARPVTTPEVGADDPALSGAVLRACSGGDASSCRAFIEATASLTFADERACPPPLEFSDVLAVALEGLRAAPPESVAAPVIREQIVKAWPCVAPRINPNSEIEAAILPRVIAAK